MARTETARETSVLPRMIQMVMGIITASVMAYPTIILGVDVRSVRMSGLIAEIAVVSRLVVLWSICGFRAVLLDPILGLLGWWSAMCGAGCPLDMRWRRCMRGCRSTRGCMAPANFGRMPSATVLTPPYFAQWQAVR